MNLFSEFEFYARLERELKRTNLNKIIQRCVKKCDFFFNVMDNGANCGGIFKNDYLCKDT